MSLSLNFSVMIYSVKQLANLAGVSVRTLHHYDNIGLLKPLRRTRAGYRQYGREELLRLQQILFYRELDFQLSDIRDILDDPDFDLLDSLQFHRKEVLKRSDRLLTLLKTIDKTIDELTNKNEMLTDKELYEGFTQAQIDSYRQEVSDRWGEDKLLETEERLRKLSKEGWHDLKQKGDEITQLLADLMDLNPEHPTVQEAIGQYHRYLNNYYEVDRTRYLALGKMYVEDERFKAHYEKFREGLAEFMLKGIEGYCK